MPKPLGISNAKKGLERLNLSKNHDMHGSEEQGHFDGSRFVQEFSQRKHVVFLGACHPWIRSSPEIEEGTNSIFASDRSKDAKSRPNSREETCPGMKSSSTAHSSSNARFFRSRW